MLLARLTKALIYSTRYAELLAFFQCSSPHQHCADIPTPPFFNAHNASNRTLPVMYEPKVGGVREVDYCS